MVRQRSKSGWMGYGQFAPVGRNNGQENPFAGTMYSDLWENNPYADMYYKPTFWDYIGLSNKAKDANSEYERLYNEYIAGIYQLQEQDKYNSPANQAKLERQAGLNPNVTGISGAGESSGLVPPNAGMNPALNGQSPAQSAFGVITQVLGFATSTLQSIMSIKSLSAGITGQNLSNFSDFIEFARPQIVNEYARRFSGSDGNNWSDVRDVSSRIFDSRSDRRKYSKAFDYLLSSSQFTASEQAYKNMTANDIAMKHFIGGLVDLEIQAKKHNYKGSISQAIYNKGFYDNLDSFAAASAQNRENNNRGWLDKWRNDYYKTLYNDWKNGSILAGLALIGLGGSAISGGSSIAGSFLKLIK